MNKQLLLKIKEALVSVLPVTGIVILLSFTPLVNFSIKEMIVFCVSAIMLVIGIGLFNLGADLAMTPMGEQVGVGLTKSKSINILLIVCFALGVFITIAEPDLSVLASQVKELVSGTVLIVCVGLGVGVLLLVSVLKIVFNKELSSLLMFFYTLIFALVALVIVNEQSDLLPLAFDSGGVTTGPITVPFIMALGMGIASTIGGKKASENSFGFIALCSAGPIIAVLCLSIFSMKSGNVLIQTTYEISDNFFLSSLMTMLNVTKEVSIALGLVVVFFFVIEFIFLKLPKKKIVQIIIGILYTYIGLIVFLTAVSIGFMPIGNIMGRQLVEGPKY